MKDRRKSILEKANKFCFFLRIEKNVEIRVGDYFSNREKSRTCEVGY